MPSSSPSPSPSPPSPSLQGIKSSSDPNLNAIPPDLAPRFDPVYLALYNKYNLGKIGTHQIPIQEFRANPSKYAVTYGRAKGPEVYRITDLKCPVADEGVEIAVRVYQPGSVSKQRGAYINFHGGGWVFGDLSSAAETLKRIAVEVDCVAFDVEYRLAPEYRYPVAVEDCWEAFQWILKTQLSPFNISPTHISVGGDSAGGHLATVISILARDASLPLAAQLLTVPVTDLTASFRAADSTFDFENTPYDSYREMQFTQPLSVDRMEYFHGHFLGIPRPAGYEHDWKINPIRCPDLSNLAPAFIYIAEMDPLRSEAYAYARALRDAGVPVTTAEAKGAPHTVMMLDGVLEGGKEWNRLAVEFLRKYCGVGGGGGGGGE